MTLLVAITACTGNKGGPAPSSASASSAVSRTTATTAGSTQKITIAGASLTQDERTDLDAAISPRSTVYVGQPVELTTTEPIPAGGIRLTRTYTTAVPTGMDATFAYWDTAVGAWHAVPSSLSTDRRSLAAVVHHLSTWTDIVGSVAGGISDAADAVKNFASNAADWGYYEVGKVFDTRVDAPTCSTVPAWVSATTFIATDRNNSLLFCTGHDPNHPDLLEVKARVNRGFAFSATLGAANSWKWNSTFDTAPVTDALNTLGHLDDTLSRTFDTLSPSGQILVGAGRELDLGFTEDQIRKAGGDPAVLTFAPPTLPRFLLSLISELVGDILSDVQQGYTAAAIVVAGCYDDLRDVHDVGTFVRAANTCLATLDEPVAGLLANYLGRKKHLTAVEAGKLAGKLVVRIGLYLALVGPVFSTMNFYAEQTLSTSARTVTVFPKLEAVTAATLRTAQVPADCNVPAQRLVNGATTKGGPGEGSITTTGHLVGYADFARAGYKQALTEYGCNAGGVGWPQVLVLIGAGGKLLGSYDLGAHDQQEHSGVTSMTVSGHTAAITWDSYEGAGFFFVRHSATVHYNGGRLVLDDEIDHYTPAKVVDDIILAQSEKKRSLLLDPNTVSDNTWNQLVGAYGAYSFQIDPAVDCTTSGATAVCPGTYYDTRTTYKQLPVTFTLTKSTTNTYGWALTDLRL